MKTGTGYNVALLAHLTRDPALVTTIDIDPALTDQARTRIEGVVGAGMMIVAGDGRPGVPERGPSARILATASAFPVPQQLAPGGRRVLDLRGQIGGGLMVVVKHEDGTAQGALPGGKGNNQLSGATRDCGENNA